MGLSPVALPVVVPAVDGRLLEPALGLGWAVLGRFEEVGGN